MRNHFLTLLSSYLLVFFSLAAIAEEINTTPISINEIRNQYTKKINEAIKSNDLDKFKSEFVSLIETFRDDNPNKYVGFVSQICNSISVKDGISDAFISICEEQAEKILQKDNLYMDSLIKQWDLLSTIFNRKLLKLYQDSAKDKSKSEMLTKQRKWQVEQMASVWKKIENKIDPAFDIKDYKDLFQPLYEISPAYSIGGMDPNSIEDEVERKKILDYLDKQNKIFKKNIDQKLAINFLNNNKKDFFNFVVKYYSMKPYNTNEVKKILTDAKLDNSFVKEMIKEIETIKEK